MNTTTLARNEKMVAEALRTLYATLTKDEADAVLAELAALSPRHGDPDKVPAKTAVAFMARETEWVLAWRGRE